MQHVQNRDVVEQMGSYLWPDCISVNTLFRVSCVPFLGSSLNTARSMHFIGLGNNEGEREICPVPCV